MNRRHIVMCLALIAAVFALTWFYYPQLPAQVPTHWGPDGRVNAYGPRYVVFVYGPGLMLALLGLLSVLPTISPHRYGVERFGPTYSYLMVVVIAMLGYVELAVLWASLGHPIDMARVILGGCGVFFALIGNVMGKVRRNFWVGIRTPWTLADERVWYATHRLAGKTIVLAALVCLAMVAADVQGWVTTLLLGAGVAIPAIYSFFCYQRIVRVGGELHR